MSRLMRFETKNRTEVQLENQKKLNELKKNFQVEKIKRKKKQGIKIVET